MQQPVTELVAAEDESLNTPFLYLLMQQVKPCKLEATGNRTGLTVGFPGLECIHCSGEPKCRRFFYRSADVLASKFHLSTYDVI